MTELTTVNQGQDDNANQQVERFSARLAYLVKVPSARIGEFIDSSALELEQQLAVIDDVDGRLGAILVALHKNPEQGLEAFERFDLRIISRDHGWREILSNRELRQPEGLPFLQVALERYTEYLRFRRRLLEFILERRSIMQSEGGGEAGETGPADASKRETSAFDRPASAMSGMASDLYRRLPAQEAFRLDLAEGARLGIMLAGHVFQIHHEPEQLRLVDENGVSYLLPPGSHSVGRSRRCDVMVDADLREVSRKHLIVEWDGTDRLTLIDLSQLGTFLGRTDTA